MAYDLISGKPFDFKRWFKPELHKLDGDQWRDARLSQIIVQFGQTQHHKDNKDCFEDAVFSVHDGYPSASGVVFEGGFGTASKFCRGSTDVTVPYANVAPYLSAEGKRAVKAIEQAITKKPKSQTP